VTGTLVRTARGLPCQLQGSLVNSKPFLQWNAEAEAAAVHANGTYLAWEWDDGERVVPVEGLRA
jgi:hypothetical protein